MKLEYDTYEEASKSFSFSERWEVFDGTKERFNIAHECVDRHSANQTAVRIKFDTGKIESCTFGELKSLTSKFANFLEKRGIKQGDRVALFLYPSIEFYVSFFGTLKRGAVVVPCFPLFGPEAIEYRLSKADAKIIIASREKVSALENCKVDQIIIAEELFELLATESEEYQLAPTCADSLAVIQFSSGTTGVPKAVNYKHAAATFVAVNLKIRIGLKADDSYFCPSSPAWGHGIWFGTVGPLIFGKAVSTYAGKFDPEVFLEGLEQFETTCLTATPLIYKMVLNSGKLADYNLKLRNLTYTGGPLDADSILNIKKQLGVPVRSFYGSTEAGGILQDFPYKDWTPRPGSLGKPMIGLKVGVLDDNGVELPYGSLGQLAIWRNNGWVKLGDMVYVDQDGWYWYKGRIDDVIISAGYTIGPDEIEKVLEQHPAVARAAVVGSPDKERGEIVKAFLVLNVDPSDSLKNDIKDFVKNRLSKHEYPREIEFINELPETPDGKIKRKVLRELERAKKRGSFTIK